MIVGNNNNRGFGPKALSAGHDDRAGVASEPNSFTRLTMNTATIALPDDCIRMPLTERLHLLGTMNPEYGREPQSYCDEDVQESQAEREYKLYMLAKGLDHKTGRKLKAKRAA